MPPRKGEADYHPYGAYMMHDFLGDDRRRISASLLVYAGARGRAGSAPDLGLIMRFSTFIRR